MTPEGRTKAEVKRVLKCYRNVHYIMPVMGGYGVTGIHDFIICVAGKFLSVECKATEHEAPTALQNHFAEQVINAGGTTLVIHAGNVHVLEAYLDMLGAIRKHEIT